MQHLNTRKNHFSYFLFTNLDFLKVHLWKDLKTEIHNGKTYKWCWKFFFRSCQGIFIQYLGIKNSIVLF